MAQIAGTQATYVVSTLDDIAPTQPQKEAANGLQRWSYLEPEEQDYYEYLIRTVDARHGSKVTQSPLETDSVPTTLPAPPTVAPVPSQEARAVPATKYA